MLELARASSAAAHECAALNALANTFFYSHRLGEMGVCAEEAICVAERAGDERARVEAMVLLAMKRNGSGELAEAKLLYDEAITAARHLNHHGCPLSAETPKAAACNMPSSACRSSMVMNGSEQTRQYHSSFLCLARATVKSVQMREAKEDPASAFHELDHESYEGQEDCSYHERGGIQCFPAVSRDRLGIFAS